MQILTDENFEKEVNSADKLILVDFFAVWCEPCSMLAPILEKISKDFSDKVIFAKVNVDNAPMASQKFGIDSIPHVILFKNGKKVSDFTGLIPEPAIRKWLENAIIENTK